MNTNQFMNYRILWSIIYKVIRVRNHWEKEDFAHDVICELLASARMYDRKRGSQTTFLSMIIRRVNARWVARDFNQTSLVGVTQ